MRNWTLKHWLSAGFILTGLLLMTILLIKGNIVLGFAVAIIPFSFLTLFYLTSHPYWSMMCLFVVNYFIMGIYRYVSIGSLGLVADSLILLTLLSVILRSVFFKDIKWGNAKNVGVLSMFLWFLYCILELVNPSAVTAAWVYNIRSAYLPFIIILLTSLIFYRYYDLKKILFLWSVFTILAIIKMQYQKMFGFDNGEMRWLYEGEAYRTVLLQSGTRYFSFFTDPGNFGSNMGYSMVVFSICVIYLKNKRLRIYYAIVAFLSMYAMVISGTRGALAVPFAGFVLYVILSKNSKAIIITSMFMFCAWFFFTQTYLGQGNAEIRRMRSAFDPKDASLVVRLENQKKLAVYLANKPFGEGLGLAGVESKRFAPNRLTTNIPCDSWYVKIWVQTGIIGLVFYLAIQLSIIAYCSYVILFRIKDNELKGYLTAILCGLFGMMVSAYGNAIFGQYPTAIMMAMTVTFIFMSKNYEKEIEIGNIQTINNGTNKLV